MFYLRLFLCAIFGSLTAATALWLLGITNPLVSLAAGAVTTMFLIEVTK